MSVPLSIGTLALFNLYYETDITKAWTIVLTTLAVGHWFNAWNCRSESKSIFKMNPFSNKFLAGATITIIALQLLAIYAPVMNTFLKTAPLNLSDWMIIMPVAVLIILVEETRKIFFRRKLALAS